MNERIKELRKALGLTLEKFGYRLGVTKVTISRIENSVNNVTDQMFKSICREFNVREEWLREGIGEMFVPAPSDVLDELATEYHLSHGSYVAIEKFVKLPAEMQERIIGYFVEVARALSDVPPETPAFPEDELSGLSIDERVALYRRELEREEKAEEESEVS